jgi:hypothetical protein
LTTKIDSSHDVLGSNCAAVGTDDRCITSRYFNYLAPSFFRFGVKYLKEHVPTCVCYLLGNKPILHHLLHFKPFNGNNVILPHKINGSLEKKVLSLPGDLFVRFGYQLPCLASSARAPFSSAKPSLSKGQDLFGSLVEPWVADEIPIRGGNVIPNANINSDGLPCWSKRSLGNIVARKVDEPLVSLGASDGDCLDIAFNRPRQEKLESADVPNVQILPFEPPACLAERKRTVSVLALESRETWLIFLGLQSPVECMKSKIKTFKDILKTLSIYYLKFRESFLEAWKLCLLVIIADRFLLLSIGNEALFKGEIIESSGQVEPSIRIDFRFPVYFRPIDKCSSHRCFTINRPLFSNTRAFGNSIKQMA